MLLVASCSLGMQAAPSRRTERNFYLRQTLQPPWTDTLSHYVAICNDVRLCVIICNNVILCSILMRQINKTSGSPLFFFNQSGKRHLSWSSDVLPCTHHRAMILGFFFNNALGTSRFFRLLRYLRVLAISGTMYVPFLQYKWTLKLAHNFMCYTNLEIWSHIMSLR